MFIIVNKKHILSRFRKISYTHLENPICIQVEECVLVKEGPVKLRADVEKSGKINKRSLSYVSLTAF